MGNNTQNLFIVIATKDRHENLPKIFDNSGVDAERIYCIRTNPGDPFVGVNNIFSLDHEINIHKWWNIGLRAVMELCGRYAAILSDDIILKEGQLQNLFELMLAKKAALVCGANSNGGKWGHAFILDLGTGIFPDERFKWFYGDDDLRLQAKRKGGFVQSDEEIFHISPGELTFYNSNLRTLGQVDFRTFYKKHPVEGLKRLMYSISPKLYFKLLNLNTKFR